MTQPKIHCMADSHCPRQYRGFRITSKKRCAGCPDARVKKWNWIQAKYLLVVYVKEGCAEW